MCTVFIGRDTNEEFPFIVAANRDEFLARPAQAMHWWEGGFLAGKDLEAGGMWLGLNRGGAFSVVTNYRDPAAMNRDGQTRGELVRKALENDADAYTRYLQSDGHRYNAFNLLYGTTQELRFYGNHDSRFESLTQGVYGLSNASLDTPWPKVAKGKKQFTEIVQSSSNLESDLLEMMASTRKYSLEELPNTGVPEELEVELSALNIRMETYGTRVTTIVRMDREGKVFVSELNRVTGELQQFDFQTLA